MPARAPLLPEAHRFGVVGEAIALRVASATRPLGGFIDDVIEPCLQESDDAAHV